MSTQAISGIVSSQAYSPSAGSTGTSFRQDMKSLEDALLNGDLSGAQSAFAALQQTVTNVQSSTQSNSIVTQLGQSSSTLGQDLQSLSNALSSNDLAGSQKAYAKLQQDIQSAHQAGSASHGHHHHHAQSATSSQSADSTTNNLLTALQSLSNSNPKVASDLETLVSDINSSGTVINTQV